MTSPRPDFRIEAEGAPKPKIAKVFPLSEAAEAVRYLIEDRPYGRVVMQV